MQTNRNLKPMVMTILIGVSMMIFSSAWAGQPDNCLSTSVDSSQECIENRLIHQYPKKFARGNGQLALTLAQGKALVYQNVVAENDSDSVSYQLTAYWPEVDHAVVVERSCLGECVGDILIDMRSGKTQAAGNFQSKSPDRQRIAAWGGDLSGYENRQLMIYRLTPAGPIEEFHLKAKNWWPEDIVWLDNQTIRYRHIEEAKAMEATEIKDASIDVSTKDVPQRRTLIYRENKGWRAVEKADRPADARLQFP